MANLLTAIAEGTSSTVKEGVKTTARKAMSGMPNPAEAVYNLGLGVGPWIRNISNRMKDKPTPEKEAKEAKKAAEKSSKQVTQMAMQLALSNALLKEIRNLQIKQLTAVNKQGSVRGTSGAASRRLLAASDARIQGAETTAAASMLSKTEEGPKGPGAGTALTIAGTLAMWKFLPDDLKESMGNLAGAIAKEVKPILIDGISKIISNSWEESAVGTVVAGLFIAHITGVLGFATRMAKAAVGAYKFADNLTNKYKNNGVTGQPSPTAAQPKVDSKLATANAEYNKLINSDKVSDRYQAAQKTAAKYGISDVESVRKGVPVAAPPPSATATPKAGGVSSALSNAGSLVKGIGWGAAAYTVGSGALDYYQANRAEKAGELSAEEAAKRKGGAVGSTAGTLAGGAYGASVGGNIGMALGGAIGALFGGVGAAPGAVAGRLLGSLVGGYFGAKAGNEIGGSAGSTIGSLSAPQQAKAQQTVQQARTSSGTAAASLKIIEQVFRSRGFSEAQIRAAQAVAAAESGLDPTRIGDNGDSVGLFQLNRASGEGKQYSVAELQDPVRNAEITADKMMTEQGKAFREADSLEEAIAALTRDYERPFFVKGNKIADSSEFQKYANRGAAQIGLKLDSRALESAASKAGSGVFSGGNVTSAASTSGQAFASTQQTLDDLVKALSNDKQTINIQNIVQSATAAARESNPGPKRTTPSGSDRSARAAAHATGVD